MKTIMQRPINTLLMLCFFASGAALADASEGDFLGYKLGTNYIGKNAGPEEVSTNGTLLITAANPVKPADINEVLLVTTAGTRTIGHISGASWFATEAEAREFARRYVVLLHSKYSDWLFGREEMDANMRINEINLDQQPYNIRCLLEQVQHDGALQWRFSMTLSWLPTSKNAEAWRDMADDQRISVLKDDRKEILDNSDTQGL